MTTAAFSPLTATTLTTTKASWGGWFYPVTSAATKTLMEKSKEFQLITDSSGDPQCGIYYAGGYNNSAASPTALTVGAWNHVICTYDGANIKTYINGVLVKTSASETNNITADGTTLLYLAETSGTANFYKGQMDDIKIWNYDLTAKQVLTDYNLTGVARYGPSTGAP